MPAETKQALAVTAHILPGEEIPLFQIETHLSMMDDGGSWWEVPAYLSPHGDRTAGCGQGLRAAKKRILKVVTAI